MLAFPDCTLVSGGDEQLRNRKLKRGRFIPEATFVPSGVAEIARLQQREGYACLRP
jgi:intracellular sulfur oxidation DsrE/DsrF family protein